MNHRPTIDKIDKRGRPGKESPGSPGGWSDPEDEAANAPFKRLSREEAAELRAKEPPVSPWRVVAVQAAVGGIAALVGWLLTGRSEVAWSLLYGAAVVVVPGSLMARGMTSRISSMAPGTSAVSFMFWEMVKIGVSVAMLVVANRIVQNLVWPALLVGLVLCIKVYWVALLWRRRK
jgi:ATP synthase protein I